MVEVAADALLREVEDDLLRAVDELRRLADALLAEAGDLLPGADQPSKGCRLLDDARVMLDVRGRGDERGELRHARGTADLLELAALLELVRERDRVDRLALRPQREARPVDRAVGAAVEIGRVEDLRDRPDRGLRQEHRAEDSLLGLEVLRRHLGERGCMRGAHGDGSKPSEADLSRRACRHRPRASRAGRTEHMFP